MCVLLVPSIILLRILKSTILGKNAGRTGGKRTSKNLLSRPAILAQEEVASAWKHYWYTSVEVREGKKHPLLVPYICIRWNHDEEQS
jgi:hypothetical protein